MSFVFLDGEFIAPEKAKVSVFDTGFYYGDGIYEVALLYEERVIDLDSHLERLEYMLSHVQFKGVPSISRIKEILYELVAKNSDVKNGMIYLQITRGVMENRYFDITKIEKATIVGYIIPTLVEFDINKKPFLKCKLEFDPRRERRDIKMISLMPTVLNKIAAFEEGYNYIIFKDKITKAITEGASSNIFIVGQDGIILTHPVSEKILNGCTRKKAIEILRSKGYTVKEKEFYEEELLQAEEVFLTGAIKLFVPVESINGKKIGSGIFKICDLCLREYKNFALKFPQIA